jgi:hypothetical protein
MSRESGIHIDGTTGAIAGLRSRPVVKPIVQEPLDLDIRDAGMAAAKVLAHQIEPGLEQIERRPERLGY